MELKSLSNLTADELRELIKQAVIDGMKEVLRQQSTAKADQIAQQLLRG